MGDPQHPAGPAHTGGGPFAQRAEAARRAGAPEEAERIARAGLADAPRDLAGRVALGLALLDQGRLREARRHFEQVVDQSGEAALATGPAHSGRHALPVPPPPMAEPGGAPLPFGDDVDTAELDRAFASAETEIEAMVDANEVAAAALRTVDDDLADPAEVAGLVPDPTSPFATRTVATLLERQGEREAAERVRAAAEARAGASPDMDRSARAVRRRRTLERWLRNLQRRHA